MSGLPAVFGILREAPADDVCDAGTLVLTPLGEKVLSLDEAGTTVSEIVAAAEVLLVSGNETVEVNGVTLTSGELTKLEGLINESYDEGEPTGFVTAYDAD